MQDISDLRCDVDKDTIYLKKLYLELNTVLKNNFKELKPLLKNRSMVAHWQSGRLEIERTQLTNPSTKSGYKPLNQEPALELNSRAAPSVEAHLRVSGPTTGRNSGGRRIKKLFLISLCAMVWHLIMPTRGNIIVNVNTKIVSC